MVPTPADQLPKPEAADPAALGRAMLGVLTAKFGAERAEAFARSLSAPTYPGTPERAAQDAAYERLTRRLIAAAEGEA